MRGNVAGMLLVGLLVLGCTAGPGQRPLTAPDSETGAPAPPPEATFSLGPDRELNIGAAPFVELRLEHAMDQASAESYLQAPGQVKWKGPDVMVVALGNPPAAMERVVIRAGARAADGRRLAADWTVIVRRSLNPAPVREEIPGGFRIGPFAEVRDVHWLDNDRIFATFRPDQGAVAGTVSLVGGGITELVNGQDRPFYRAAPVLGGQAVLYSFGDHTVYGNWIKRPAGEPQKLEGNLWWHLSPAGTALITHGHCGAGYYIDLHTGAGHPLAAAGACGSYNLNAWSPDGSRYLVQATRQDPVPGFYFFNAQGQPAGEFHEPGRFGLWGQWSPDGKQIAFLSVPLDVSYPAHGEAVFEPAMAPEIGVLDVAAGKARYYSVPGLVAGDSPRWAPDGRRLAASFGTVAMVNGSGPDGKVANLQQAQVYILDLGAGALMPVTPAAAGDVSDFPSAWSSDGSALLVTARPPATYRVVPLDGSPAATLPGDAAWATSDLLVSTEAPGSWTRLLLFNRRGEKLGVVASGFHRGDPVFSPDRRHVAVAVDTWPGSRRLATDPPATYLVVMRMEAVQK